MGEGSVWRNHGEVGESVGGICKTKFNLESLSCLHQGSLLWWFSPFSAPWSSSFATCSVTRAPTTPTKRREQSLQRAQMLPSWTTTPTSQRPLTKAKRNGSFEGWLFGCGIGRGKGKGQKHPASYSWAHPLKYQHKLGEASNRKFLRLIVTHKKYIITLFNISL